MQIVIDHRYKPYSLQPGVKVLVPSTSLLVQIFPSQLSIRDLSCSSNANFIEYPPIDQSFTVFQDMERGHILIRGFSKGKAVQKEIVMQENQCLLLDKKPVKQAHLLVDNVEVHAKSSETRIHFGCYKKPNMMRMRSQALLHEYLPFWHALGKRYSLSNNREPSEDTTALLMQIEKSLQKEEILSLAGQWQQAFQSCLKSLFVPTRFDEEFFGFVPQQRNQKDPLEILSWGSLLIEKMILEEKNHQISLGRKIPKELHCGRATCLIFTGGKISCEWSKKQMKKVKIEAEKNCSVVLDIPKVQSVRIRNGARSKGTRVFLKESFDLISGKTYFLDQMMR